MLADTMGRLFTEALQKGKTEGRKEGRKEGRQEGRKEGRDEGAAWMLTKLIEQRFGPIPDWARAHIQSAGPEQLMRWGQLILTAPSLEALFEPGHPSH